MTFRVHPIRFAGVYWPNPAERFQMDEELRAYARTRDVATVGPPETSPSGARAEPPPPRGESPRGAAGVSSPI